MRKSDLIELAAKRGDLTIDRARVVVDALFDEMTEAMRRGERIEIRDFGNFTVKEHDGYEGRNPRTGEPVQVPQKRLPLFRAGKGLKDAVNEKER